MSVQDDFVLSPEDILVAIGSPVKAAEITLAEWMTRGPGERRFAHPVRARLRSSGEELPLAVIPIPFRNDHTSRYLIATGQLTSPWSSGSATLAAEGKPDPESMDRHLLANLLERVDAQDLGATRSDRRILDDVTPAVLRRLASAGRWDDFDGIAQVAADLGLRGIGPVLCEVLDSEAHPDGPIFFIDTLALLGTPEAVPVLVDQFTRSVASGAGPVSLRCLYALYGIGTSDARRALSIVAQGTWSPEIRRVASYLSTFTAWGVYGLE